MADTYKYKSKIKVPLSSVDRALELTSVLMILILWAVALFAYLNVSGKVPIHYNASGAVTNYASKTTLFLLPVLGTFIFVALGSLCKHPHIFNYAVRITAENAERQYKYATRMLRVLTLAIVTIFTIIVLFTYLTSIGKSDGLGSWFLPFVVAFLNIPTGYYIIKAFKAK